MDCIFCKIANKEIPAKVVFEDEAAIAFLDVTPRAPGHVMVIPKQHVPTLLELPDGKIEGLFKAVKRVDAILQEKLGSNGMTIGINQGAASGQEIGHLHIHLIPRYHGDGGGSIQSVVNVHDREKQEKAEKALIS